MIIDIISLVLIVVVIVLQVVFRKVEKLPTIHSVKHPEKGPFVHRPKRKPVVNSDDEIVRRERLGNGGSR